MYQKRCLTLPVRFNIIFTYSVIQQGSFEYLYLWYCVPHGTYILEGKTDSKITNKQIFIFSGNDKFCEDTLGKEMENNCVLTVYLLPLHFTQ